jgi:hypothetical protein
MAELLTKNSMIRGLRLSSNQISDVGVGLLMAPILAGTAVINELLLAGNQLSSKGELGCNK